MNSGKINLTVYSSPAEKRRVARERGEYFAQRVAEYELRTKNAADQLMQLQTINADNSGLPFDEIRRKLVLMNKKLWRKPLRDFCMRMLQLDSEKNLFVDFQSIARILFPSDNPAIRVKALDQAADALGIYKPL